MFISRWGLLAISCVGVIDVSAQSADTVRQLREVTIQAYAIARPPFEAPSAVGLFTTDRLVRTAPTSLLPALNTVAGVRMEERSPGSYRLAIRGSALRSPFGVRNVKIYFNGLPLTDAGGNTYLNLLDGDAIGQAQIIKGPGASLYGAGTGGVLLLDEPQSRQVQPELTVLGGGWGQLRTSAALPFGVGATRAVARLAYQQADGYRAHSAFERLTAQVRTTTALSDKSSLAFTVLHGRIGYQTPGGLTEAQFKADPRQARPPTPTLGGAQSQNARVDNATTLAGVALAHDWSANITSLLSVSGLFSDFTNAAILNWENRWERSAAVRNENTWHLGPRHDVEWVLGFEWQRTASDIDQRANDQGVAGARQFLDALQAAGTLAFTQITIPLPHQLSFTGGLSSQWLTYRFERSFPDQTSQTREFTPVVSPRVALAKKIGERATVFVNWSTGFAPPTLAEVRPSSSRYNATLAAERGQQWEGGIRYRNRTQRLQAELTAYRFVLREALVVQRDETGADFFVNAGRTQQPGVEGSVTWEAVQNQNRALSGLTLSAAHAWQPYRFVTYRVRDDDFSGNELTGVPRHNWVGRADGTIGKHFRLYTTTQYTAAVPLNDANNAFSRAFWLLSVKADYAMPFRLFTLHPFVGVDNVTNRTLSLGDDINAAGGRFFNAAPGRFWYAGIRWKRK